MKPIEFTIEGKAIAQPAKKIRVFEGKKGKAKGKKFVSTYTEREHPVMAWRERIRYAAGPFIPEELWTGAVKMEVDFFFPRPKAHYGTGRNVGNLKASAPRRHITKPDTENLMKPLKDVLEQMGFFKNDSQVYDDHPVKHYCGFTAPRVEVRIEFEAL